MNLGITIGDKLLFLANGVAGNFEIIGDAEAEPIMLRNLADGSTKNMKRLDLAVLVGSGKAITTLKKGQVVRPLTVAELKGFHQPPKRARLSETELKNWEVRKRDIARAGLLLWYAQAWDLAPCSRGEVPLTNFILAKYNEAKDAGFTRLPSTSSIRKAIAKGLGGPRTLAQYLRKTGGARKKTRWPQWVYDLGMEMVCWYYEELPRKYLDAHDHFDELYYPGLTEWKQTDEARKFNDPNFEPPCPQTLTNWINSARTREMLTLKYGSREADRRLRGRSASLEPVAPLETIILDQTLAPIWAAEKVDVDGTVTIVLKRPWITWAIDLYSRMCVGFIITFDPPCLATLMACLRHVISPKTDWIDRFGEYKGATDGFGAFYNVILDNAKAHFQRSMKMVGDVAGFKVTLAPIYTPQYKSWIERFNATMNGPIRTLPGGIPLAKDQEAAEYDARATAALAIETIRDLMGHHVMAYHLDTHDGIGMAPARKWVEGLQEFDRPLVEDARAFKLIAGRLEIGALTGEGLIYREMRFHDQGITTMLMNNFSRLSSKRGKPGQSSTFPVFFFVEDMDTSSVTILDEFSRQPVELPNFDELHRESPVSFAFEDGLRERERRLNKKFHTREEKAQARIEYTKELNAELAKAGHGAQKNIIRVLKGKEKLSLGPGSMVLDLKVDATVDGMEKPKGIPMRLSITERIDPVVAQKGRKRRAKSKPRTETRNVATPSVQDDPLVIDGEFAVLTREMGDDEALLDELARLHGY
ncbi:hypothetical protein [Rhizobium laguerreae]|uniref:hypothetical protein n=1 Tax=Rhizobium laguerreae TaxID=1076926 RepID=UPI001C90CA03|nr:hypothetical protein [Rhizobium laguerreae]MBY3568953.1 transposase family protein [Rhizobium laguerreae]